MPTRPTLRPQLNYNDYNLENEAKRNGAVALIKKLKAQGIPITSVGLQGHDNFDMARGRR